MANSGKSKVRVKLARFRVGANRICALARQELVEDKLGEEELKAVIPQDVMMQEFCSALFRLGAGPGGSPLLQTELPPRDQKVEEIII